MIDKRWALPTALLLFITLILSARAPGGAASDGLIISEVMAKNNGALADDEGNYPDWIELHNPTDKAIGLKGYSLTDDSRKKGKFVFPEMEIGAGDYLVVFASGTERVDAENRVVHMPFSINSQKEDIVLYDPHSREISRVEVRDLPDNTTCGPDAQGKTVYFKQPTPGAANAETYTPAVRGDGVAAADAKVRLNEYATKGSVTLADEDGEFTAWVELHNYGDIALSAFLWLTRAPSPAAKPISHWPLALKSMALAPVAAPSSIPAARARVISFFMIKTFLPERNFLTCMGRSSPGTSQPDIAKMYPFST